MTSIKVNTFLTKHLTDNIMDYAPQGEESKEKYMQSTYKWQWYAVWETTVKRQIPNDN